MGSRYIIPRLSNGRPPFISCTFYFHTLFSSLAHRSGDAAKRNVATNWLTAALRDFDDPAKVEAMCATRRSAGLPHFLQALLGSYRSPEMDDLTNQTFTKLITLLDVENGVDENDLAIKKKTHALNCLVALVRDSSLATQVVPHVDMCLMYAVRGERHLKHTHTHTHLITSQTVAVKYFLKHRNSK